MSDIMELSVFIFYAFELMRVRETHNILSITAAFVCPTICDANKAVTFSFSLSLALFTTVYCTFFLSTLWRAITSNSLSRVCKKNLASFRVTNVLLKCFPFASTCERGGRSAELLSRVSTLWHASRRHCIVGANYLTSIIPVLCMKSRFLAC